MDRHICIRRWIGYRVELAVDRVEGIGYRI